jgi:ATP-binding cassette subfamily F protein uup
MLGQEAPDKGTVKIAKNLDIGYFDQKREDLELDKTLIRNLILDGGDHIEVMGSMRHVRGYLKQFLFDPARADDKAATLSGGQKNRLMLAKILSKPGHILVLDEPTNDLDMETMEMLEEIIANYDGTLFIVSHDRDFLDQTVMQILAFEGNGDIEHVIGGYSDYLEFKTKHKGIADKKAEKNIPAKPVEIKLSQPIIEPQKPKITFKEKYALDNLPKDIDVLNKEIKELSKLLANPNFYQQDSQGFNKAAEKLERKKREIEEKEFELLELQEKFQS